MLRSDPETSPVAAAADTAGGESSPKADRISATNPPTFLRRTAAFLVRRGGFFVERNSCGSDETTSPSWDSDPNGEKNM